ncbi:MAG: hypothetical protein HY978_01755 [Candidatus Liptonbacteria bacterium]|nr:hypothetical protein [Candidatus Liptonbacteria bacterium]
MRRVLVIITILILSFSTGAGGVRARLAEASGVARAETRVLSNLGFLRGNIWYSKDPFYRGDTVRIYSAVFNSTSNDLVGTVEFYDNGFILGRAEFSVAGNGRIKEVWTDWTATAGTHNISAKIVSARLSLVGGQEEPIRIANSTTGEDQRVIAAAPPGAASSTLDSNPGSTIGQALGPIGQQIAPVAIEVRSALKSASQGAQEKLPSPVTGTLATGFQALNSLADIGVQATNAQRDDVRKLINSLDQPESGQSPKNATGTVPGHVAAASSTPSESSFMPRALKRPIYFVYLGLLTATAYLLGSSWCRYPIYFLLVFLILYFCFKFLLWLLLLLFRKLRSNRRAKNRRRSDDEDTDY